jgi:hypothetical protein
MSHHNQCLLNSAIVSMTWHEHQTMTVDTHRGAHKIHLYETDGIQIRKQVLARIEVGFFIPTLHS